MHKLLMIGNTRKRPGARSWPLASHNVLNTTMKKWCPRADSNHRHSDFQSLALPTELLGHLGLRDALARLGSDAIGGRIAACLA